MAVFKVVHFFRDSITSLGWSEVWYVNATDMDAAHTQGVILAKARVKLLAISNELTFLRVTGGLHTTTAPVTVRNQRMSTLDKLELTGDAGGDVKPSGDYTTTCVKVRWQSADFLVFRTQLLRGVPDDWFKGSEDVGKANTKAWVPVMLKALFGAGAVIRHLPQKQNPPVVRTYAYVAPASGQFTGYTRRATGRVFDLPRGRRPNRS